MASKRQRGEGSSSQAPKPYDKKRFVSETASERYNALLTDKSLIPERGVAPEDARDCSMGAMIHERGWQEFVAQPEAAVVSLVKEFYANAKEARNNIVQVRGKAVAFDKASINAFYGLVDMPDEDELTKYRHKDLDWSKVIQCLCRPGTEWVLKGSEAIHFPSSELSRYGKAWFFFICAKLLPSMHTTEVIKERAVLLYALVTGKSINVGNVIYHSICHAIRGSSTGGLPHPSLICGLCKQAKVAWVDSEILQQPRALIDGRAMNRYKVWNGAESDPRGAGFLLPAPNQDEGETAGEPTGGTEQPSEPGASSSQSPMDLLISEMRELRRENQEFQAEMRRESEERRKESRRHSRRIDHAVQQASSYYAYSSDYHATIAQVISSSGFNLGPNALPFPAPPIYQDYASDSADAEPSHVDDGA